MSNRTQYDEALRSIGEALRGMGEAAADADRRAFALLAQPDAAAAQEIIEGDKRIDEREKEIEHACLALLLRQQPVAADLRFVSAALKLVTDLERIGDHAADLAEISLVLEPGWQQRIPAQAALHSMADTALGMVRSAVAAFADRDLALSRAVIARDDEVDAQFDRIKRTLADYIACHPGEIDAALDLLMVTKYLERLGDHAVNIAEWVGFLQTGCYRGERIV